VLEIREMLIRTVNEWNRLPKPYLRMPDTSPVKVVTVGAAFLMLNTL